MTAPDQERKAMDAASKAWDEAEPCGPPLHTELMRAQFVCSLCTESQLRAACRAYHAVMAAALTPAPSPEPSEEELRAMLDCYEQAHDYKHPGSLTARLQYALSEPRIFNACPACGGTGAAAPPGPREPSEDAGVTQALSRLVRAVRVNNLDVERAHEELASVYAAIKAWAAVDSPNLWERTLKPLNPACAVDSPASPEPTDAREKAP